MDSHVLKDNFKNIKRTLRVELLNYIKQHDFNDELYQSLHRIDKKL